MSDAEDNVKKITVTVKTPKEKQTVEVQENATINEVSTLICTRMCFDEYIGMHLEYFFDRYLLFNGNLFCNFYLFF